MRFLQVPRGTGLWGVIYYILGLVLSISALSFIVLNIVFSAFGLMIYTDAEFTITTNNMLLPFWPTFSNGGRIGLLFGLLGGIFCSVVEISTWVSPSKSYKDGVRTTVDKKEMLVWFSIILLVYDVLSTLYFLNGATFIDLSNGFINGVLGSIQILFATILFFSVGAEMFFVYGLEMLVYNWQEGCKGLLLVWDKLKNFLFKQFGFGDEENNNKYQPTYNPGSGYQQVVLKRGRGRPRKEHRPEHFGTRMVSESESDDDEEERVNVNWRMAEKRF